MQSATLELFQVSYENSEEFHSLKREIFVNHTYYVDLDLEDESCASRPIKILDAGAHIGLTSLYFSKQYPNSQIIAIEPLPQNFTLLQRNIFENQLSDTIQPYQLALSDSTGKENLFYDKTDEKWFSTAGFSQGAWNGQQSSQVIAVPTVPLVHFLHQQQFDIVKLDIEGVEQKVLTAAKHVLHRANHYLIEYHPIPGNSAAKILKLFEDIGFTVTIFSKGKKATLQTKGLLFIEASK